MTLLDVRIDPTSYAAASGEILRRAREGGGYVCLANVHMVMEAYDNSRYRAAINQASLVTPDGMPLVWALRWLGERDATRVYGPDLMLELVAAAAWQRVPIGIYGSREPVLADLTAVLRRRFAHLRIVFAEAPPQGAFDRLDEETAARINASGARILFVGLGCPKQELWMARHEDHIRAVMIGAGAAFDFIAGHKPQAPRWMMASGLEWLFRLATEPRRLWKRYLRHNPRFVYHLAKAMAAGKS